MIDEQTINLLQDKLASQYDTHADKKVICWLNELRRQRHLSEYFCYIQNCVEMIAMVCRFNSWNKLAEDKNINSTSSSRKWRERYEGD